MLFYCFNYRNKFIVLVNPNLVYSKLVVYHFCILFINKMKIKERRRNVYVSM